MSKKMRATCHMGRIGFARHCDRSFDLDLADHLHEDMARFNEYFSINDAENFEESELKFYKEKFSDSLEKKNRNYVIQRHPERCKTMEQIYKNRQFRPEEIILQVGDKDGYFNRENLLAHPERVKEFVSMANEFFLDMDQWSKEHGNPFTFLTGAIHFDESTGHLHLRRTWHYIDDDGLLKVGQNRALAAAGIPDPLEGVHGAERKRRERTENRKVIFTQCERSLWLGICKKHGHEIEDEPLPNGKNRKKIDFIEHKIFEREKDLEKREEVLKEKEKIASEIVKSAESFSKRVNKKYFSSSERQRAVSKAIDSLFSNIKRAVSESKSLPQQNPYTHGAENGEVEGDLGLLDKLKADEIRHRRSSRD